MSFLFLLPVIILGGFAAIWLLVTTLLAMLSGWGDLADEFRAMNAPEGDRRFFVSGGIGRPGFRVNYRNCLTLVIASGGFFLSVWPALGGFRCPRLFIPWSAIEGVEAGKTPWMHFPVVRLRCHWPTIALYGEAGEALHSAWSKATGKP